MEFINNRQRRVEEPSSKEVAEMVDTAAAQADEDVDEEEE